MREYFNRLITTNVLKSMETNSGIIDMMLADADEAEKLPLKNVCAKISPDLADDIDSVCGLLGISKRRFIEGAFIEALRQAREIIKSEGLDDYLAELSRPVKEDE